MVINVWMLSENKVLHFKHFIILSDPVTSEELEPLDQKYQKPQSIDSSAICLQVNCQQNYHVL